MKIKILAILCPLALALAFGAAAQDRTPWVEPPLGALSAVGATIEVENYRCTVTSERTIRCINIGRVCVEYRAAEEKRSARTFGCAIKGDKNYPCPPDDPAETKARLAGFQTCAGMMFGGY